MTPKDFIERINEERFNAHKLMVNNNGHNITRGRNHTISEFVEDIFSVYVADLFGNSNNIYWVEPTISYKLEAQKRTESFKPDVAVISNNVLTHYFDMKTSIGYSRGRMISELKKKNEFVQSIRGMDVSLTNREKEKVSFRISENLVYQMVIVYGWAISVKKMNEIIEYSKSLPCVDVHLLCPHDTDKGFVVLDNNAFEQLDISILNKA